QARQVIDKFEEEETRLASLTGDQMRMLRGGAKRDSVELTSEKPSNRARRDSAGDDEMTRTREPINPDSFVGSLQTTTDDTRLDSHDAGQLRRAPGVSVAATAAAGRRVSKAEESRRPAVDPRRWRAADGRTRVCDHAGVYHLGLHAAH